MTINPTLLENESATGGAEWWTGGRALLTVEGTFGGATLTLQYESPNSTYIDVPGASFTADGMVVVELAPGNIRMEVSGGSPSALYAHIQKFGM